jgi:hypothetical protein
MKTCSCCKIEKPLKEFGIDKKRKDGRNIYCLFCAREKNRKYNANRKKRTLRRITEIQVESKTCVSCNTEKHYTEFHKSSFNKDGLYSYCKTCDSKKSKKRRKKYQTIKIEIKEKTCISCNQIKKIEDFPKHKGTKYGYRSNCRDCENEYLRNKYENDPLYKLNRIVRARIRTYIKLKTAPTENVLGCSWEFYEKYLQEQFEDGMSWDNHGEWEIDHTIPLASAEDEETLLKLFHYTNTKPLWYNENRSKGDKILN